MKGRSEEGKVHGKTENLEESSELNIVSSPSSDEESEGLKLALIVKLRSEQSALRSRPTGGLRR